MAPATCAAWFLAAATAAPAIQAAVLVATGSEGQVGSLMRREMNRAAAPFSELNPPEASRTYSSIFDNNAIGTGHARSTLDSPQAWSAAQNNKDQWMVIDAGALKAVKGAYFQARGDEAFNNQIVTKVHFEYSKDCITYTPVEQNRVFDTKVVASTQTKNLVTWSTACVGKCFKIWVDGWSNHVSMRAGLYARDPEEEDESTKKQTLEYEVLNPPEASRNYSSIFDNNAIGSGHARSMLDSPQAWSAAANDKDQWMTIKLDSLHRVNGVYVQGRNKASCCGNQIVTKVWFERSINCRDYYKVNNGTVMDTMLVANEDVKRFVAWPKGRLARCVKIYVDSFSGHISMRAGLSGYKLVGLLEEESEGDVALEARAESHSSNGHGAGSPTHEVPDSTSVAQAHRFDFYGDGAPTQVA